MVNDLKLSKDFDEPQKQELSKFMKDFLVDNTSGRYYLNRKGVSGDDNYVTALGRIRKLTPRECLRNGLLRQL